MIRLFTKEVTERFSRENFFTLDSYLREEPFRKGNYKFLELVVPMAVSNKKFAHNLTFQPLDIIMLSVRSPDTATVTWHYDSFDRESIVVTTSSACTIRAYIGRYTES